MTKIFFPFNDQPKKFPFKLSEPIRFPFYVNDVVYFWEVGARGITMYLVNNKIADKVPVINRVSVDADGITMYLFNHETKTSKHIFVEFAKIGLGIDTLGILDPLTLGDIDDFTLGQISACYADWMEMSTSVVNTGVDKVAEALGIGMDIESDAVLPYDKRVYTGELHDNIGVVGLNEFGHMTLGELDPQTLADIDDMLSTFRTFGAIPASLVKEIHISLNNVLQNNIASPNIGVEVNGNGVICHISAISKPPVNSNALASADDIYCRLSSTSVITTSSDMEIHITQNIQLNAEGVLATAELALEAFEHHVGIANGSVPLQVSVSDVAET